jgi:hypothetical protein
VILLDDVVEVLDLAQLGNRHSSPSLFISSAALG